MISNYTFISLQEQYVYHFQNNTENNIVMFFIN